jgi:hypothetical protein
MHIYQLQENKSLKKEVPIESRLRYVVFLLKLDKSKMGTTFVVCFNTIYILWKLFFTVNTIIFIEIKRRKFAFFYHLILP